MLRTTPIVNSIKVLGAILFATPLSTTVLPHVQIANIRENKITSNVRVNELNDYADKLLSIEGFKAREKFLHSTLNDLNKFILPSLKEFNSSNNLSLECMGIRKARYDAPAQLVFINTFKGKDKTPIVIYLSANDTKKANSKTKMLKLFKEKLALEKANLISQHNIWKAWKQKEYDLPKGGMTSVMYVVVPKRLTGIWTDLKRIAELYNDYYQAKPEAICVESKEEWNKTIKGSPLEKTLPEAKGATKAEILSTLETSLKKAIDENKSAFVFYYMMQGLPQGLISATDEDLNINEIGKVLATQYNGKPISAQIDITIVSESCFAGDQVYGIVDWLKWQQVGTKNLRVIGSSESGNLAEVFTTNSASLLSDKMRQDPSSIFTYYLSYYYEYLDYLKSQGLNLEKPFGTFYHAIWFADRMARADALTRQDLQGIYHSYDPKTKKSIDQIFSKLETYQI